MPLTSKLVADVSIEVAPFSRARVDGSPKGSHAASAAATNSSEIAFRRAARMALDAITPGVQTALPDHGADPAKDDHPRPRVPGPPPEHPGPQAPCRCRLAHAPGARPDGTRFSAVRRPDPHLPRHRRPDRV